MELQQVRYFLALARSLNFTRAAEQCNVSQPGLTKAIKKLEEELGGQLVYRERRRTQLTDLGKLLLPMLERVASAAVSAKRCAADFQQKSIASLTIGLAPCISANIVTDVLSAVARQVPGLKCELIEAPSAELVGMLLEGEINVAISSGSDELPQRIDHWQLFEEPFVVLASRNSRFAALDQIPIELLSDVTWLERTGCKVSQQFWTNHYPSDQPLKIGHRGRHDSHLQHMVAADLGVMLAPEHTPRLPTVIARPIRGNPLRRAVRLLAVAGRRYSPALDAFIKVAKQRVTERPPQDFANHYLDREAALL